MKKTQIFIGIALVSLVAGTMISASVLASDSGLECAVLPSEICAAAEGETLESSGIWRMLILLINVLTAGVGILAVGAIVYAGFLYTTAQGDTGKTKQALEMIRNTVIGLLAYILMYAGANFLIPGGIFTGSGGNEECRPGEPC